MSVVEIQQASNEAPNYVAKQAVFNDYIPDLVEAGVWNQKRISIDQMDERI